MEWLDNYHAVIAQQIDKAYLYIETDLAFPRFITKNYKYKQYHDINQRCYNINM